MQIATIHQWQHALDSAVRVLRLVWRHLLKLIVIGMIIAAIAIGKISWINCFYFYVGATFWDWFKMKWTLDNGQNSYHQSSSIISFTQQNYWNADIVGTPAYLSNLGHRY